MNTVPLVSVILLSYNQSDYVEDAIVSVTRQTYTEWELIVIDNGSTDGSQSIIKKYLDDNRVRVFLHPVNMSICKRMNEGVAAASGDFISILYSDDYYLPEKLDKQVSVMRKLSPEWGVAYSPGYQMNVATQKVEIVKSIESSGEILKELFTDFFQGYINPISPLIRKECLLRYPFDEEIFTEGEAIFFRIAMKYKFIYVDEPLVVMRVHDNNARYAGKQNAEYFAAGLNKLGKHGDFPDEVAPYYQRFKGILFRNNAWQNIRLGADRKWARNMLYQSIRSDWRQILHPKSMAALMLSFLPTTVRKKINLLANMVLSKHNIKYFEKYYPDSLARP